MKLKTVLLIGGLMSIAVAAPVKSQQDIEALFGDELRLEFLAKDKVPEFELDSLTTGSVNKRDEIFKYCLNISDAAMETRTAVLKQHLEDLGKEVDGKLDALDKRIASLADWLDKRQKFLDSANDSLVEIFSTMRSDAAALQFTELGPSKSAAIISKLDPKTSSAILAEMKPEDAAKITVVLSSAMKTGAKVK